MAEFAPEKWQRTCKNCLVSFKLILFLLLLLLPLLFVLWKTEKIIYKAKQIGVTLSSVLFLLISPSNVLLLLWGHTIRLWFFSVMSSQLFRRILQKSFFITENYNITKYILDIYLVKIYLEYYIVYYKDRSKIKNGGKKQKRERDRRTF